MEERQPLSSADSVAYSSYQTIQRDTSGDISPSDTQSGDIRVYRRRWWIMFVFCFVGFVQGYVWNTFGPLNFALMTVYGWDASDISLTYGMCSIGGAILIFPTIYLAETRGMRFSMLTCTCILLITTSLWILALVVPSYLLFWFGGIVMGGTNGIFMAAPPLLSVLWFPVGERTTATALATASSFIGSSISFVTGPLISDTQDITEDTVSNRSLIPADTIAGYRDGLYRVGYTDAALVVLTLIMTLAYFPSRPPKPPSHATQVERIQFMTGFKVIRKNKDFWLLFIAFNLSNGPYNSLLPVISVSLKSLDISEDIGGWLGFLSVCGCVASVFISMFVDFFKRKGKVVLVVMNILQVAVFSILLCVLLKYIHFNKSTTTALLYILCICMGIIVNGVQPVYYEMACELAFPVQEGLSASLLVLGNLIFGVLFFMLFLIPQLAKHTVWVTWLCLITSIVSLVTLLLVKQRFTRLDLESTLNPVQPTHKHSLESKRV